MKVFRIVFIVTLILATKNSVSEEPASKAETIATPTTVASLPQSFPIMIFPDKGLFVTTEDDPLLISVQGSCAPGTPDTAQFELLPPTPGFVRISDTCRGFAFSYALIEVVPGRGDVGKHKVTVRAINCEGQGGTFSFRIKVKP